VAGKHWWFWPGGTVIIGMGLAAFYYGYAERHPIGAVGAEGDIGGGLIPLVGIIMVVTGTVLLAGRAVDRVRARHTRRGQ
jgi:hypothetical protein